MPNVIRMICGRMEMSCIPQKCLADKSKFKFAYMANSEFDSSEGRTANNVFTKKHELSIVISYVRSYGFFMKFLVDQVAIRTSRYNIG